MNPTLDDLIEPEIKDDEFSAVISQLASENSIKTFLEIGSSTGDGSTKALVESIKKRSDINMVALYCLEVSIPRFQQLLSKYSHLPFFFGYNMSSISLSEFPEEDEVIAFYQLIESNLRRYSLSDVLAWRYQDIEYLKNKKIVDDGINAIKKLASVKSFDFVLIDGSEFTGERELNQVIGSKLIALDDVLCFKCFNAYQRLKGHAGYVLLHENMSCRNGFAVFGRRY